MASVRPKINTRFLIDPINEMIEQQRKIEFNPSHSSLMQIRKVSGLQRCISAHRIVVENQTFRDNLQQQEELSIKKGKNELNLKKITSESIGAALNLVAGFGEIGGAFMGLVTKTTSIGKLEINWASVAKISTSTGKGSEGLARAAGNCSTIFGAGNDATRSGLTHDDEVAKSLAQGARESQQRYMQQIDTAAQEEKEITKKMHETVTTLARLVV